MPNDPAGSCALALRFDGNATLPAVGKVELGMLGESDGLGPTSARRDVNWLKNLGPGFLVTAAFIGPGTITTASKAGAEYGFALVWALAFAVVATIVLQEMCARLGLVTRQGLGEAMRTTFKSPLSRALSIGLVIAAIGFGNAAFETGNVIGAAGGLESLTGIRQQVWAIVVGVGALLLLACGTYKLLERVLIALVVLMSAVFVVTAIIVRPDMGQMLAGTIPRATSGPMLTVVALIGTTVVPYNLFLHASAVGQKWPESVPLDQALKSARRDASISISIGGLITLAVMATAAATFFGGAAKFDTVGDMADQLGPLFGAGAKYFFATGLLAAGLTSAITAPLAAAYAVAGVMGWQCDVRSAKLRVVWASIVVVGTVLAAIATKPVAAIMFAQAANGILLPLVAAFLLAVMNRRDLLGRHANGPVANSLGAGVVLTATMLGCVQVLRALGALS